MDKEKKVKTHIRTNENICLRAPSKRFKCVKNSNSFLPEGKIVCIRGSNIIVVRFQEVRQHTEL